MVIEAESRPSVHREAAQDLVNHTQGRDGRAEAEAERTPKLARAVHAHCQTLIGELFGWQFAPDVATDERSAPVLFEQLAPRVAACDPSTGDLRALAPSPEVNRSLRRLVAIIQHADCDPAHAAPNHFEYEVHAQLLRLIQSEPVLRERAHTLRKAAALAETALEHHYSRLLLNQLTRLNAVPSANEVDPECSIGTMRTRTLERCLAGFPYTHNYLQLLAAEVALLECPSPPLLLRDRELRTLPSNAERGYKAARDRLRSLDRAHISARAALGEQTMAVCGCGPLPITGLMLHTWTGARVRLIDRNTASAEAARAWVHELERLQVLWPGYVEVVHADLDELTLSEPDTRCDIALVASLVEHDVKQRLAQRVSRDESAGPHSLLLRSATGLCAELAYEAVDTRRISSARLPFCGESLPRTQVWPTRRSGTREGTQEDAHTHNAAIPDTATDTCSEVLVIAHRDVLNSTELYRRIPLSDEQVDELAMLAT